MRNNADEVEEFTEYLPDPAPVHYCNECDHYEQEGYPKYARCKVSIGNESDKYTYRDWEPEYDYCSTVRMGQGITCEWYRKEVACV